MNGRERKGEFTKLVLGGSGGIVFRPFGAGYLSTFLPTACAVGCVLSLLRSWGFGGSWLRLGGVAWRIHSIPVTDVTVWDGLIRRYLSDCLFSARSLIRALS